MDSRQTQKNALSFPKLWLTLGWLLVACVVVVSLWPRVPSLPEIKMGDKLAHLIAYAILMLWFANLYQNKSDQFTYGFGFIAMGIFLECIQGISGYRYFQYSDMLANCLGVMLGWFLAKTGLRQCISYMDTQIVRFRHELK